MSKVQENYFFDAHRNFCITCPIGFDLESDKIQDWIAYHNLLGADCFVLFVDTHRISTIEAKLAYRKVASIPNLVHLVNVTKEVKLMKYPASLLECLRLNNHTKDVKYLAYMDVDEFITPEKHFFDGDEKQFSPVSILSFLDRVIGPGNNYKADALYFFRWDMKSNHTSLSAEELLKHPLFWYLDRSYANLNGGNRSLIQEQMLKWGKMVGRIESPWKIRFSHHSAGGKTVTPDGKLFVALPNTHDTHGKLISGAQPFSISHLQGPLDRCEFKANHGAKKGIFRNRKTASYCRRGYESFMKKFPISKEDVALKRFADATRFHSANIFHEGN